jgi:hypothetical protein
LVKSAHQVQRTKEQLRRLRSCKGTVQEVKPVVGADEETKQTERTYDAGGTYSSSETKVTCVQV